MIPNPCPFPPKIKFEYHFPTQNSPLGPKKAKNDPKVRSKSKVRVKETIEYTHEWCNDKPYEWDLETLEGNTFVGTNRQEFFSYREL